jgi:GTP-binding protein Era
MGQETFRSGFVALLGRPNVGKSTLLNALVGNKISIISSVPQTTRYQIRGILNLTNCQIVFVDTPGMHSFKDELVRHLNTIAKKTIAGCELILYVVDASRSIGREEETIMDMLASQKGKIIMVLNKIDLGINSLNDYINAWRRKVTTKKKDPLIYYLPTSAKKGKNIEKLKDLIVENLPLQPPFYEPDRLTDFPLKFRIADIIREELFLNLKKELPHALAVEIEEIEKRDSLTYIRANIYVNRNSQKRIVIGQNGKMLKKVGEASRKQMEGILGTKVYLDIWVKILKDWQKNVRILKELGYWWA